MDFNYRLIEVPFLVYVQIIQEVRLYVKGKEEMKSRRPEDPHDTKIFSKGKVASIRRNC